MPAIVGLVWLSKGFVIHIIHRIPPVDDGKDSKEQEGDHSQEKTNDETNMSANDQN